jgi:hypothetical protein
MNALRRHHIDISSVPPEDDFRAATQTPTDREKGLRRKIQELCNKVDAVMSWEHGEANKRVFNQMGCSREDMTEEQLHQAWNYANELAKRYNVADSEEDS